MTTAIGYVRVSRVGGRRGDSYLSPELQRQSIQRVCQREGLALVDVLEELDKSGGEANRPLWNQAIERVVRGEVGALVVWNLDRFSRSVVDALAAIDRITARHAQPFPALVSSRRFADVKRDVGHPARPRSRACELPGRIEERERD